MKNSQNSKLYTTISQSFAVLRCGASKFLKNQKFWTIDGELSESNDNNLVPAYSLCDLMNIKLKDNFEIPITGNSQVDIQTAISKIIKIMMNINKFPFRVWNGNQYLNCGYGCKQQILIDPCGNSREFVLTLDERLSEIARNELHEIEIFTGYFDRHGVPIFDHDAVLFNGKIAEIKKENIWLIHLMENQSSTIIPSLQEMSDKISVIGSSR